MSETHDPGTHRASSPGGASPPGAQETLAEAARAAAGNVAGGLDMAEAIGDRRLRDRTRASIAYLASDDGRFDEALTSARAIADCDARTSSLMWVARAQGAAGEAAGAASSIAEALAAARGIGDEAGRVLMLVDIWTVQRAIGNAAGAERTMDEALALAGAIEDGDDRIFALAHIARNQGSRGELAAARRTVAAALGVLGGIVEGRARASALCWIAEAQARSGDRAAALGSIAAAQATGDGAEGCCDLEQIAVAQATAGADGTALETARRAAGRSRGDGLLSDISEVQCWENHVAEAVATALEIGSPCARCAALVNIGSILLRDGDPGRAAQPVALAEETAEAIRGGSARAHALLDIARLRLDAAVGRGRAAG